MSGATPAPASAAAYYCGGQPATIVGTWGNDTIQGTTARDVIVGLGGADTIFGNDGDDVICGGGGNDTVYAGNGNDVVFGGAGRDSLNGGGGDDSLNGEGSNDRLVGDGGNDTLNGGYGNDVLIGGDGSDTLNGGDGNDNLEGGNGNDLLRGGNDSDYLSGASGNDLLKGGPGDDKLRGGSDADRLFGDGGSDELYGDAGNDRLFGGDGSDELQGGVGNDRLFGGYGNDLLDGGSWSDHLNGGPGADVLNSGPGNDTIDWFYPETDSLGYLSTDDVVNMNWLSTTMTSGSGMSVAVPIYGAATLKHVRTSMRPLIRSSDPLVISSGNGVGSVDTSWVNAASKALRKEFPDNQIAVLTSGMSNIWKSAGNVGSAVDAVLYGYEPNFPNEPEFSWYFNPTKSNASEASGAVRNRGFESGIYITGRPVLQKREWDWGWGSYGWDYGQLKNRVDHLYVQTQTYCADGLDKFAKALDRLNWQVSGDVWPQVTITPELPNSVPLWKGKACTDRAKWRNMKGMMVWWSPSHVDEMIDYLKYMGRG